MRETIFTALLVGLLAVFGVAQNESPTSDAASAAEPVALEIGFSQPSGFHDFPIELNLICDGATLFFTLDGSRPTEKSAHFRQPIRLEKTTVLRVFAKKDDETSRVFCRTYFINEPKTDLPTVSIAITPGILFDPTTGLFQEGPDVDYSEEGRFGANFWSRKEVTCNAEIFENDGSCVHNSLTGFRLFGGFSRIFPQKSLVLSFRKEYGKKFFKHKIFGPGEGKKFKYLVLRNGGSDWGKGQMRDALIGQLTDDWGLEKQAYRPAHLFINGKYWGLYDLREKINARFLADRSDADKDSIDFIEHRQTVRRGSIRHYSRMLRFIDDHDLARAENFQAVQKMMDVDNFIDLQVAEIWSDNTDAGGNIRFWRPQKPGGKWRWILFDMDWGMGLYNPSAWAHNSLDFFTEPNGPEWPNPPWSTFLLRNLLKNRAFETAFINRFCDRLNTSLASEKVLATISDFEKRLAPELPRQWERWHLRESTWQNHLEIMRTFAEKRPAAMLGFLGKKFAGSGRPIDVVILNTPGGEVVINECISVNDSVFKGKYFENVPIRIKAVPRYGFRFVGWAGVEKRKELQILPGKLAGRPLRAVFEKYEHPLAGQIFFNEVVASNRLTGDWLELKNSSKKAVNLRGWIFTDGKNDFELPDFSLPPGEFLIVCENRQLFERAFPAVKNVVGDLGFGLDKTEEKLLLFAADGGSIDSAFYRVQPTDEVSSIDLLLPKLDNGNPENWRPRFGNGSPGAENPFYQASLVAEQKELWLRVGLAAGLLIIGLLAMGWRRFRRA